MAKGARGPYIKRSVLKGAHGAVKIPLHTVQSGLLIKSNFWNSIALSCFLREVSYARVFLFNVKIN